MSRITVWPDNVGLEVEFYVVEGGAFLDKVPVGGRTPDAQSDITVVRQTGQALVYEALLTMGLQPDLAAGQAADPSGLYAHSLEHELSLTPPVVNVVGTGSANAHLDLAADTQSRSSFLVRCGAGLCALADATEQTFDSFEASSPWPGAEVAGLPLNGQWGTTRVRTALNLPDETPDPTALDVGFDDANGSRALHLTAAGDNHTTTHSVATKLVVEEGLVTASLRTAVTFAVSGGNFLRSGMRSQPSPLTVIAQANQAQRVALEANGFSFPSS